MPPKEHRPPPPPLLPNRQASLCERRGGGTGKDTHAATSEHTLYQALFMSRTANPESQIMGRGEGGVHINPKAPDCRSPALISLKTQTQPSVYLHFPHLLGQQTWEANFTWTHFHRWFPVKIFWVWSKQMKELASDISQHKRLSKVNRKCDAFSQVHQPSVCSLSVGDNIFKPT